MYWTEIKASLRLAGPLVLAQLAQMSLGFIDAVMVGHLGPEALAAVALGSATFFPLLVVNMGVITAVSPLVAQAYGAGRPYEAGRAVRQGLWLAVILSIPALLVLWNAGFLLRATGQAEAVIGPAQAYLRAIALGYLPALWLSVLRNFVEGFSRTRPVMLIMFLGVGCNIVANYVLMFGKLGFPALGLVGTGLASTIVYTVMFISLALYIQRVPLFRNCEIFSHLRKPDWEIFRELLRVGLPAGAMWGFESSLFAATAYLMGVFGPISLAAHHIAIQCAAFTFMVPLGVSLATAVRVGQAVGRDDPDGVRRAGYSGILISTVFMSGTALAFWLIPRPLIGLYLDLSDPANAEVVRLAVGFLAVAAVFQVFDGVQATSAGALRGLKDTRVPMVLTIISYWLVGMTAGVGLGFGLDLAGRGLWWGLVFGLAVAAVLLTLRFQRMMQRLVRPVAS